MIRSRSSKETSPAVSSPRRRSEPRICFGRGEGAHLFDLEGRRYIDYHAAYGAIFLGHSHPAVIERVSGEAPPEYFIGPSWCLDKNDLHRALAAEFARRDSWQGKRAGPAN